LPEIHAFSGWGAGGGAGALTEAVTETQGQSQGRGGPGGAQPEPKGVDQGGEVAELLAGISPAGVRLMAIGLTCCVAVGDYLTGSDVSFTLLYLGPIGLATWFVGVGAGGVLSLASAVVSMLVDVWSRAHPLPAAVLVWNLVVQLGTFMALTLLLGVIKARLEHEQHAARTDHLTQVANRRAFVEMAAVELERARRTGRPLTVAYLDIDDFKRVNDLQGHARGDALLITAASTLRGTTRSLDVVARLGGDEFGLLLVDTDGPTAESLLQRLRTTLALAVRDNRWDVTFSIGAATFLSPARSVDEMMGRADQLMYEAKRAGKDAVRLDVVGPAAQQAS
jgi:diguanylate cyclase (GGDEF)-like protein